MRQERDQIALAPLKLSTGRTNAAEALRQFIGAQGYQRADKLPSERKLATQLGISRSLLREAMSTLEGMGLIEIRHGSGSYVSSRVAERGLSSMWSAWYAAHGTELVQLLQVREALEAKATALAIEHGGDDLVPALRDILDEMEQTAACNDLDAIVEADRRFHGTIVQASGNTLLAQLLRSLDPALEGDRRAVFSLRDRRLTSVADHRRILEAIERRDQGAARMALEQHFESVLHDVVENVAEEPA